MKTSKNEVLHLFHPMTRCCCLCTLVVMATESFYSPIMGKLKTCFNCCLISGVLTELNLEMIVELSSIKQNNVVKIPHFDLLPWQLMV